MAGPSSAFLGWGATNNIKFGKFKTKINLSYARSLKIVCNVKTAIQKCVTLCSVGLI